MSGEQGGGVSPNYSGGSRRLPWLLGVLLVLGAAAIYRHVGQFGFLTFDDEHLIVFNPHMGPLTAGRVHWAFTDWGYVRRYMPLGWLGFSTVFSISGLHPAGYHVAGLALHAANSVLLFRLLLRMTRSGAATADSWTRDWSVGCAFLGAAFWAWHPLRVESVAWSSALLYGESEFFLLLGLIVFARAPESLSTRLLALAAFTASLLCYPVAIGFAPVFGLLAGWRLQDWRRAASISWPFFVPAVAVTVASLLARAGADAAFIPMPSLAEFPLVNRVMQACYVSVYYAWIPFWPTGLRLFNPALVDFNPWSVPFVLSAAALIVVAVVCLASPKVRRAVGLFLVAYVCVLVPMMGLVERPYFPSDRYSGFTQGVLAVALVLGVARLSSARFRTWIAAGALAACGVLAVLSGRRTEAWRDAPTVLNRATAGLSPGTLPTMRFERPAVFLYRNGDAPAAIALLDQGIAQLPHNPSLPAARADLLRQWSELRAELAALGAPPATPRVALMHQELGVNAARAGDLFAAEEHLRLAREWAPDFYQPAYNLALVHLRQGETRAALGSFLWADAHAGGHLSRQSRTVVLKLIGDQFEATGQSRLAAAARAGALRARSE